MCVPRPYQPDEASSADSDFDGFVHQVPGVHRAICLGRMKQTASDGCNTTSRLLTHPLTYSLARSLNRPPCCREPDPPGPHCLQCRQLGEWRPSVRGREARGSEETCQADPGDGAFAVLLRTSRHIVAC